MYRQPKPKNVRGIGIVNVNYDNAVDFHIDYRHGLNRMRWVETLDVDSVEYRGIFNNYDRRFAIYCHLHRMMARAVDAAAPKAHCDYLRKMNPRPVFPGLAARIDEVFIKALAGEL
ncbi:hypothetical protein LC147_11810 [Vibrio harveyi]|uniref:hypothetical protein n=1 Tax=Vibrio harveyi TaxID=669 RepID=UPI003BB70F21